MNHNQPEIPIQPVERPILCSPYEEPIAPTGSTTPKPAKPPNSPDAARRATGTKRNAPEPSNLQLRFVQEEEWDDLPLVNRRYAPMSEDGENRITETPPTSPARAPEPLDAPRQRTPTLLLPA